MNYTDSQRLQWILNHVTQLEGKEMVAGNFENFIIPATREAIDHEMRGGTSPMLGLCKCYEGICGQLQCPIHGFPKAKASMEAREK